MNAKEKAEQLINERTELVSFLGVNERATSGRKKEEKLKKKNIHGIFNQNIFCPCVEALKSIFHAFSEQFKNLCMDLMSDVYKALN